MPKATLEDIARHTMNRSCMEYWNEFVLDIDGEQVSIEVVVTSVNGIPRGRQYESNKALDRRKEAIVTQIKYWTKSLRQAHKAIRRKNKLINRLQRKDAERSEIIMEAYVELAMTLEK